jgi:hypothetical protein
MMAEAPEARARQPRSPSLASTLEMMVPSGMELTGKMLPTVRAAKKNIIRVFEFLTFSSTVDEHSGVHAFNSDEIFSTLLVSVLVSEDNLGKGGTSAWIVHNVPHNTLNVSAFNY